VGSRGLGRLRLAITRSDVVAVEPAPGLSLRVARRYGRRAILHCARVIPAGHPNVQPTSALRGEAAEEHSRDDPGKLVPGVPGV
jgi:hypothetical protein